MRAATFLGCSLLACGSPPAPVVPPPAVAVLDPVSTGPVLARSMDPSAPRVCSTSLRVARVAGPAATCPFEDTPSRLRGILQYACGGGPATATLGAFTFEGQVEGAHVHLETRRERIAPDGCHWQNVQSLDGTLDHSVLEYSYREQPTSGSGCVAACVGGAPVMLER